MLGGAIAGSGMEKELTPVLTEVSAVKLLVDDGGGGAATVGWGGRVSSGVCGGAGGESLETAPSPED